MTDLAVLAEACLLAGLDAVDARLVREGENTIYQLRSSIYVRISRPGQQAAAVREVAVSRWLNAAGVAAVSAVGDIQQPIICRNRPVTFWTEIPRHRPGYPAEIAAVLARLHALPVPENLSLGYLDPFVRLPERIASADIAEDDRIWLLEQINTLRVQWDALIPGLSTCVVHGDAWSGNVVSVLDGGRVILMDLERCSVGPPQWDLTSTAVKVTTDGRLTRAEYEAFVEVYGSDVMEWNHFTLFRDIRELRMTTFAVQAAGRGGEFRREAKLRIACLRGRSGDRPWSWTPIN
ncbi:aminoglycoside phosphotransferase family protein [Catenulispora yoronensis]|uniref:Aminoglycoside phosphotransferase family protein n=1 Tax=Catenulispora yoronensis TaxID=450799 RepID=A0ABP5FPX4_9ACTN